MAHYVFVTRIHRWLYHHSRGWLGGNLGGNPMVLMYTIGAKTGQVRATPVMYHPLDPAGVVVLASNNGQMHHPAWYHNLKAQPEIDIRVGRQRRRVRAEEVDAARRQALLPEMIRRHPLIADHLRHAAGREPPVMLLRTLRVY